MRHPGGPSAGTLPQVQRQPSGNGWGIISDDDQGPEAPSLGPRHFHRHWFGHRGPALGLPLQQKSRTSSADGAAALSTRFRANSCYLAPQGRNSPFGSHGSCGPGTIRPISTSTPFSPGIDDTSTITAHVLCQHPLAWPSGMAPPCLHLRSPPSTSKTRWNSWTPRADGGGFGRCGAILSAGPICDIWCR